MGVDITNPDSVNAMVSQVVAAFGRIDVLVNSAALDPKFDPDAVSKGIAPGKFEEYPLEQWNAALNVNLTGTFLVTQACVKQMLAQGKKGSVINICSTYGLNGQGSDVAHDLVADLLAVVEAVALRRRALQPGRARR